MNKFHQIRKALRLDLASVAGRVGIDEMQLALFEHGMGWLPVSVAYRLANVVEVPIGQIFPLLRDIFDAAEEQDDDKQLEAIYAPQNRSALIQSGIDPDRDAWFAIVQLRSGNERRYFLTSMEFARLRADIMASEDTKGFLTFHSDCQNVILRKSAISSIRFTTDASYAWFRSHERDFVLTVVSDACPRPVKMEVTPDGYPDGNGPRPFADLLSSARGDVAPEGEPPRDNDLPPFLSLIENEDETIVSFDGIEVIEIPCGVLMPHLYEDDEIFAEGRDGSESLKSMEMMGEA
jgi:hypothetical protein